MTQLIPEQTPVKAEHLYRLRNAVLSSPPPPAPGCDEEARSLVGEAPCTWGLAGRPPASTASHLLVLCPCSFLVAEANRGH